MPEPGRCSHGPKTFDSNGNASVPAPGYTTNADGTYNWVATYSGDPNNVGASSSCGAESVVVSKNNTSITTEQSNADGATVGTAIKDTAHVTGNSPTGSVTFFLYGPGDKDCVNNADSGLKWLQPGPSTLNADGKASVPDQGYTTMTTGRYQWVAHYSGDANNTDAWSSCGNEPVRSTAGVAHDRDRGVVGRTGRHPDPRHRAGVRR